jgi:hypothetical protein
MKAMLSIIISSALALDFTSAAGVSLQDSAANHVVYPDSLRIMIDAGEFRWRRLRYEAEVRVSAIYAQENQDVIPESLIVWIDVETPGASFWVNDDNRNDFLVLHKNDVQVKGKIRWFSGGEVRITAHTGRVRATKQTEASIPVLLLLVTLFGGMVGGWLRRVRDPSSVIKLPGRLLSEKWSRRLAPVREMIISMIAAFLLYLLNEVSPIYIEFRSEYGPEWLVLAQPLLVGFIGGWGGINLLVGLLAQVLERGKKSAKAETSTQVLAQVR